MSGVAATLVSRFCPNCHQSYGYKEVHVCPIAPTTEQAALVDPLIGSVLGERYKIENYVSSGGMGVVYKARHIVLDKPIAIKLLREAQDADAQQRFLLEAKSACHIGHEHIVDITDFGVLEDGRPYLVMEFLVGKSLETVIREGALPPRRVCRIGEQIARGLQAVHEKGILHRDLKPGNVFLLDRQKRDFVKILDFGIAKVMAGTRDSLSETEVKPLVNMRATTQGTVLGTPEYLSPEQASGEPIDARVDQYALGCILYEMLTGDVPFRGNGPMSTLMKHLTEKPVPPRVKCPELNIPESLERIVLKAMASRRDDRFANMDELAQALLGEVEGNSFVGDNSAVIPNVSSSWSGVPLSQLQGSSGTNKPVPEPGQARRSPSSANVAITARSPVDPSLATDKRSPWLYRGLGALAGLMVVAVALLIMQVRATTHPPKGTNIPRVTDPGATKDPVTAGKDPTTDTQAGGTDPSKPKTDPVATPGTDPTEEHGHSKGDLVKWNFLNDTPVRIKLACVGQKPLVVETRKSGLTKLNPAGVKCEATAPGYKTQVFAAAELRKSVKKGKGKLTIKLVPDKVPNLSLIKQK